MNRRWLASLLPLSLLACRSKTTRVERAVPSELATSPVVTADKVDAASDVVVEAPSAPPPVVAKTPPKRLHGTPRLKLLPNDVPPPTAPLKVAKPTSHHALDAKGELATFASSTVTLAATSGLEIRVHTFEVSGPEYSDRDHAIVMLRGGKRVAFHPFVLGWSLDPSKRFLRMNSWENLAGGYERRDRILDLDKGTSVELPAMSCLAVVAWDGDRLLGWGQSGPVPVPKGELPFAGDAPMEICVFDSAATLVGHARTTSPYYVETGTFLTVSLVKSDRAILAVGYGEYRDRDCAFDFQSLVDASKSANVNLSAHPSFELGTCSQWEFDFAGFAFEKPSFRARSPAGTWIDVK